MCGFHTISDVVFADACLCTNMREGEGEGGGGRDREIKRERERGIMRGVSINRPSSTVSSSFFPKLLLFAVFFGDGGRT